MTLLALKRQNIPLKGDVIFLGTADEEAGGAMGAGYLLEKHPELFANVGLVLNEGGGIRLGQGRQSAGIQRQRGGKDAALAALDGARGQPGHGSTPGSNLAVNKLIAALQRVHAISRADQSRARSAEVLRPNGELRARGAAQEISRSARFVARSSVRRRICQGLAQRRQRTQYDCDHGDQGL